MSHVKPKGKKDKGQNLRESRNSCLLVCMRRRTTQIAKVRPVLLQDPRLSEQPQPDNALIDEAGQHAGGTFLKCFELLEP